MPSVTISDEMFDQLAKRDGSLNVTVEQLIAPLLDLAAADAGIGHPAPTQASFESREKKFDAWMMEVQARADRYPTGFVMDDSRESIYEGYSE